MRHFTRIFDEVAPKARLDVIKALEKQYDILDKLGIYTVGRLSHFLAQLHYESKGFQSLEENLNYSALRASKVFPHHFESWKEARPYAMKPQKLANYVYAHKLGNGNSRTGDGWKYRGRGIVQLTGKAHYKYYGMKIGVNLVKEPDLAANPTNAVILAALFWTEKGLNKFADEDDAETITKRISGKTTTLEDRAKLAKRYEECLNKILDEIDTDENGPVH